MCKIVMLLLNYRLLHNKAKQMRVVYKYDIAVNMGTNTKMTDKCQIPNTNVPFNKHKRSKRSKFAELMTRVYSRLL
jgi:hypothetical protein